MRKAIAISTDVRVYEHRPPPFSHISCFKRLAITIAAPLLRPLAKARHKSNMSRVSAIMAATHRCNTREDLERVLGKPAYAVAGHNYGRTDFNGVMCRADRAEVYLLSGCTIELVFYFKEGGYEMIGFPTLTATDVVLMRLDHPPQTAPQR